MWTCRKCNAEVEDNFEICWSCGTSVDGAQDPSFHRFESDEDVAGPPSATNPASADQAVPIATYWVASQAQEVQALLENAGVTVLVAYEFNPAGGTILLQVAEADVEKAQKLLAERPQQTTPLPPAPPKPPEPDEATRYREQPWLAPIPRDLSREETLRFLEAQVSALIDSKDVPDWKVNPSFHPDVMAFIQQHANNAGFVQKAQGLQRNRAKYFATIRAQQLAPKPEAEVFPEETKPAKPAAFAGFGKGLQLWLITKPLRLLRRLLKLTVYLTLALLLLGVMGLVLYRGYSIKQLEAASEEVDQQDPQWTWEDLQARRPEVPEKENAALVVLAVAQQVGDDWPGQESPLRLIAALPADQPLGDAQEAELRAELEKQPAALAAARQLERFTTGRYPLPAGPPPLDRPRPWLAARPVGRLLALDAALRTQDQDADAALLACRALLRTAGAVGDEPDPAAQMLRCALRHQACRSIARVLAQGGKAGDDALALTQRLLEDEAAAPVLAAALRGQRALAHESLAQGVPDADAGSAPEGGWQRWLKTGWHNDNRARNLRMLTEAVLLAQLPVEQQPARFADWDQRSRQAAADDSLHRHALAAATWPAAVNLAQGWHHNVAELRCAAVLLALERCRLATGQWPATLNELTTKYLAAVPLDPYDGQPLRYRVENGGATVYSIGPDARDDQGDLAGRRDVGFHQEVSPEN